MAAMATKRPQMNSRRSRWPRKGGLESEVSDARRIANGDLGPTVSTVIVSGRASHRRGSAHVCRGAVPSNESVGDVAPGPPGALRCRELTHRARRLAVERTEPVATYLVLHEVDDVEHWLSSSKREEIFGPMGVTARTFHDPEDSSESGR
jgi:hypothetical protein